MRRMSPCVGIGLLVAGVCLLLSCFLPSIIIVCIEAALLIVAGLLFIKL